MIIEIQIIYNDLNGSITYDTGIQEIIVDFPDKEKQAEIEDFLAVKKIYRIPESNKIDDYREELAFPFESTMHFELALCELWSETDVFVNWKTRTEKKKNNKK